MNLSNPDLPLLSICTTCRDGREDRHEGVRGGARLAEAILDRQEGERGLTAFRLRGVRCMSQCKRPCAIALAGPDRFTYVFGDLNPEAPDHIDAVLALASLYQNAPEGFLRRDERPEPLQAGILGRLPPLNTTSDLVTPLLEKAAG